MTDGRHSTLVLRGIEIKSDERGRFCLNDLYRASGGAPNKKPALFLKTEEAKDLSQKIRLYCDGVFYDAIAIVPGRTPEIYASSNMALAYARWISSTFQQALNQAFEEWLTF